MRKEPFYDEKISRIQQEEFIDEVLAKYAGEDATEELVKKVYDDLMMEKHKGKLTIPFKVLIRKDESQNYPPHVEVILDTRV